jgi:hypothetical protein
LARYFYIVTHKSLESMKKQIIIAILPILLLTILAWTDNLKSFNTENNEHRYALENTRREESLPTDLIELDYGNDLNSSNTTSRTERNKIVSYANEFLGSPYLYAGTNPNGFDCSGFISFVYQNFGLELPHSSSLQAKEGYKVTREEARKGDLVIFTGTNLSIREPGHVGIVISTPGDTLEFVHSSSNGGVKISKLEGTRYDKRFLQIRRIL